MHGVGQNRGRACTGWNRIGGGYARVGQNRGRVCTGWDRIGGGYAQGGIE